LKDHVTIQKIAGSRPDEVTEFYQFTESLKNVVFWDVTPCGSDDRGAKFL
jgi:hypothetical protein